MNLTDLLTALKPSVLNKQDRAAALPYLSMVPGPVGIGADVAQNVDAYGPAKGMMASVANIGTPAFLRGLMGKAAGGMMGGVARQMYGGERAKTADQKKLAQAKEMEEKFLRETGRLTPLLPHDQKFIDIYNQTGWFRGKDGKWRFEISDTKATPVQKKWVETMIGGNDPKRWPVPMDDPRFDEASRLSGSTIPNPWVRMDSVLKHDDLYAAYPDLAGMRFAWNNRGMNHFSRAGGDPSVAPKFGDPYITLDRGWWARNKPTQVKPPLLHELTHAVQDIEGFARGGNLTSLKRAQEQGRQLEFGKHELLFDPDQEFYKRLAGEVEAFNVEHRANMTAAQRKRFPPWYSDMYGREMQIIEPR